MDITNSERYCLAFQRYCGHCDSFGRCYAPNGCPFDSGFSYSNKTTPLDAPLTNNSTSQSRVYCVTNAERIIKMDELKWAIDVLENEVELNYKDQNDEGRWDKALDTAIKSIYLRIPMMPITDEHEQDNICPTCFFDLGDSECEPNFCPNCGQRIEW